jgi:hypothetical protein
MESMLNLAIEGQDERARGSVGMKLIDKLLPPKTGPLVSINNRPVVNFNSHLNLPTDVQEPTGQHVPPRQLSAARTIEASSLSVPRKSSYLRVSKNSVPKSGPEPLSSSDDTAPDDRVTVAPEPDSPVSPDAGKPVRRVLW